MVSSSSEIQNVITPVSPGSPGPGVRLFPSISKSLCEGMEETTSCRKKLEGLKVFPKKRQINRKKKCWGVLLFQLFFARSFLVTPVLTLGLNK